MMRKFLKSTSNAIRGFLFVWREERNFRIEAITALLVLIGVIVFRFSFTESALMLIFVILVLAAEMVNTAIEDLCDKIEPNHDAAIGKIKDISAGFTLLTSFGSLIIGILTILHHFLY